MSDPPPEGGAKAPNIDESKPPSGGVTGSGGGTALGAAVGVEPYQMERTRAKIALFLLWIMVGIIVVVVLISLTYSVDCWLRPDRCTSAKDALAMLTGGVSPVLTALVGLVGSVVGFYFGSRQA
jgi:hypothetical protein